MAKNYVSLAILLGLLVWWGITQGPAQIAGAWPPMRIAGLILCLSGLALLVVARVQLGGSFSVRARARKLVTHGLYSRIRNPIYVFGSVATVGGILYFGKPLFLLIPLLVIPVQLLRSRREEAVLAQAFGEEYQRYKAQTWF